MGERQQWIINLQSEVNKISGTGFQRRKKPSIHRVPKNLRDLHEEAYTPQFISIGPYHHGEAHLKSMEPNKRMILAQYLERAGKTVAQVVEAMRPQVQEMMDSYDGLEVPWTDEDRFLELMILDGCFVVDYPAQDSLQLSQSHFRWGLWSDLYKVENQVPLSVLDILIQIGGHRIEDIQRFVSFYPNYFNTQPENRRGMINHLLELRMEDAIPFRGYYHDFEYTVRPATELFQAGVSIKKAETECLNDISFSNGVLSLPCFHFNSFATAQLLNFIAYEQLHRNSYRAIYYAFLMDNLIDTANDVALLRKKGIITCWTGSDNEIASFFNSTTKELIFYYQTDENNVNKHLEEYCNKRWHKWRAIFIQTYFSNPWVFISLLGALILLFLSIAQTVYAIMPYYKKNS